MKSLSLLNIKVNESLCDVQANIADGLIANSTDGIADLTV